MDYQSKLSNPNQQNTIRRDLLQNWKRSIYEWFPDLLGKSYFVPPIHTNAQILEYLVLGSGSCNTNIHISHLACNDLFEQKETEESELRGDRAQLLTIQCLWRLARHRRTDVMVVLSRYNVGSYMNKSLTGQALYSRRHSLKQNKSSVLSSYFPVPRDGEDKTIRRGEFNILIIHKMYGFFVLEVQALEDKYLCELSSGTVTKKLHRAMKQLRRLEQTLRFMTSDIHEVQIPITKMLALPLLWREKLNLELRKPNNTELRKDLVTCFGVSSLDDALSMCLCNDEVEVLSDARAGEVLSGWWGKAVKFRDCFVLNDEVYTQIVARFCGPLSTVAVKGSSGKKNKFVEVRNYSEGVYEMKTRYEKRVLRSEHKVLLSLDSTFVFLSGPPGSGKTLVLLLKACQWVSQGDVIIVVRGPGNNPGHLVSRELCLNIQHLSRSASNVYLETVDAFTDPRDFVDKMTAEYHRPNSKIRFLIDEIWVVKPNEKLMPLLLKINKSLEKAAVLLAELPQSRDSSESAIQFDTIASGFDRVMTPITSLLDCVQSLSAVPLPAHWKSTDITKMFVDMKMHLLSLQTIMKQSEGKLSDVTNESYRRFLKVSNLLQRTHFFVDIVFSWLASPVLYDITQAVQRKQDVGLWCTGGWSYRCPTDYQYQELKTSIRCPPHVQRLLEQTEQYANRQNRRENIYVTHSTNINPSLPVEGELIHILDHGAHVEANGKLGEIKNCERCAENLAKLLLDVIRVGNGVTRLQFRDVLIMDRALLPMTSSTIFLRKMQALGIPCCTILNGSDDKDLDVDFDVVIVTNTYNGHGLEKGVVVFVPDVGRCQRSGCQTNDAGASGANHSDSPIKHSDNAEVGAGISSTNISQSDCCRLPKESSTYSGASTSDFMHEPWFQDLGIYNKRGLWFAASRSVAEIIIFHV